MRLNRAIWVLVAVVVSTTASYGAINLTGTVTDSVTGAKLENVAIVLKGQNLFDSTDAAGYYQILASSPMALPVINGVVKLSPAVLQQRGRALVCFLPVGMEARVDVFGTNGRLVSRPLNSQLPAGEHQIKLDDRVLSSGVFIVQAVFGTQRFTYRFMADGRSIHLISARGEKAATDKAIGALARGAVAAVDTIVACKAGYACKWVAITAFTGVNDLQLVPINPQQAASAWEDGSAIRVSRYGEAQVFWGDIGGQSVPLVKIVHAESEDAVDVVVMFNPGFVDNTYGTGAVGWSPRRGHTFRDLYISDHVEIMVKNCNGDTVFFGKLDLLHPDSTAASGYASLGPFGGDGSLVVGDPADILSFGTSLDDNINYYGYRLFENSPATDSVYTTNPDYPYWEYNIIYRLTLDPAAFGTSGYCGVSMTYVHASPAKVLETIQVTEGPVPVPGSPEDVFQYRKTYLDVPPSDDSSNTPPGGGTNPPTDSTDSSGTTPPPDDGSSTVPPGGGTNPPSDSTDSSGTNPPGGGTNPPSDSTDTSATNPPGGGTTPPPDDGSSTTPPGGGGTTPPGDNTDTSGTDTLPPTDQTTIDSTVPPPDDGSTTLPPSGGGSTPPDDGSGTNPPGGGGTPPTDSTGNPTDTTGGGGTTPPDDGTGGTGGTPPDDGTGGTGGTPPSDGSGTTGGAPPDDGMSNLPPTPAPTDQTDIDNTVPPPDDGGSGLPGM